MSAQEFNFRGMDYTSLCGEKSPHPPHIHDKGGYDTVRYKSLKYFCRGKAGNTQDGELIIREWWYSPGGAASPAQFQGEYYYR